MMGNETTKKAPSPPRPPRPSALDSREKPSARGLVVALLGPDGAGKSTLIKHLSQELSGQFSQSLTINVMPRLFRKPLVGGSALTPHDKPVRSLPASLLKLFYYVLDHRIGHWIRIRPALSRSTLVLFDRYYDDLIVDPKRYRYGAPLAIARWATRLVPRPDLWIVLDAPEETIHHRKQELSQEEIRRQRVLYRELSGRYRNSVLLDGTLPPERLAQQTADVIRAHLRGDREPLPKIPKRKGDLIQQWKQRNLDWLSQVLQADKHLSGETREYLYLGFSDGRAYLLPRRSRRAAATALSLYTPQRRAPKLARKFLELALRLGVAQQILPRTSLNLSKLERLVEHATGEKRFSLAVSLGTPGPDRTPVIQILTETGEVLGYVKVGWNHHTTPLVQNEKETLSKLLNLNLSLLVPQVLHSGEWDQGTICIQSPPPCGALPFPRALEKAGIHALHDLSKIGRTQKPLEETSFWKTIQDRSQRVKHLYWRDTIQRGAEIARQMWSEGLPLHLAHGDFTPWNARLVGERAYLFDWEYACPSPAGYDLFHFHFQISWLVDEKSPLAIYRSVLENSQDPKLQPYWSEIGLKPSERPGLFLLYLLERLTFWASKGVDQYADLFALLTQIYTSEHGYK